MSNPEFQLTRLILIDSYCAHRIVELDISGHITLNGDNGAGKTTLLRLLPVFFGESPVRIIKGGKVNIGFSRYYFPSTSSYVIYEYLRRGQKAMAIIHPNGTGEGVVYRFVESEYRKDLLHINNEIIQPGDLHRHLDKLGVYESLPLSLENYRQVIQNTASTREMRNLAARFSFVGSGNRLSHLERVVTAIFQRTTSFDDMKRIVASSILDSDSAFSMSADRKSLQQWLKEYEAYNAVMAKAPLMEALEQLELERGNINTTFSRLHAQFSLLKDHFLALVQRLEKEELSQRNELERKTSDFAKQIAGSIDKCKDATATAENLKRQIDFLKERKSAYTTNGIDGILASADALPSLTIDLDNTRRQLATLEQESKSITEIFTEMDREATDISREQLSEIGTTRSDVLQQFVTKQEDLTATASALMSSMRLRQAPELEAAVGAVSSLEQQIAVLTSEMKNPVADPATVKTLADARAAQQQANGTLSDLHDKTSALQRVFTTAQQLFSETEADINRGMLSIEGAEAELDTLLRANNADERTLLGFLRKNKPDWTESIGRVISPETLLRNDLAPEIGAGDDLFGVRIDLEKLEAGRYSSEDAIQKAIQQIRQRIEKRKGEVAEDSKKLAKQRDARMAAQNVLHLHEADITKARALKEQSDHSVVGAEQRVAEGRRQVAAALKARCDDCQERLIKTKEAANGVRTAQSEEIAAAERGHNSAMQRLKEEKENTIKALEARKTAVETTLAEKKAQISKNRDLALTEKGVSVTVLNELRVAIGRLELETEAARRNLRTATEYREWLATSWSQLESKEQQHQTASSNAAQFQRDLERIKSDRNEALSAIDKHLKEIGKLITGADAKHVQATNQVGNLANWAADPNTLELDNASALNIDALTNERRQLTESLQRVKEGIRSNVEQIRYQMYSRPGTRPFQSDTQNVGLYNYPTSGIEHLWIPALRGWFNKDHEEMQSWLQQEVKVVAQNISAFHDKLDRFNGNVESFARSLNAQMGENTMFDSVTNISAQIKAVVNTKNYWGAISELRAESEAWHNLQESGLPPASFIRALSNVVEVINEDHGLVADPIDLIDLTITANVNGAGIKTASNEHELAQISSNGLSYIILCIVLIGFIDRIRKNESIHIPFLVDELKDLSFKNARTLINVLTKNRITMISAFPDVDPDLAGFFAHNYKVLPGRKVGLVTPRGPVVAAAVEEVETHV